MIKHNGWYVDIFAVEVGARGYCSRSLTICLKRLGFPNKLAFSTARKLGQTSMKCSFCIWLARNSKEWSEDISVSSDHSTSTASGVEKSLTPPSAEKPCEVSFNVAPSVASKLPKSSAKGEIRIKHAGFYNKGNTCYANSILQALSAIPPLWSQSASEQPCVSPLVKSVALNMSLLNRSTSPIDPSNFLRALQQKMSTSIDASFHFNTQQDAPEILRILLEELKGTSSLADELVSTTIETTVVCDVCLCFSTKEEKMDIIPVPLKKHITNSLHHLLQIQPLTGANMWFCPQCKSNQNATTGSNITKSGSVLILQLRRYDNFLDNLFKDNRHVQCLPINNHHLKVPITTSDEVSIAKEYSLVATVNHSGTLNAGHYWAFVKDGDRWLECNDRSVIKVNSSALNNSSCYILFYVQC